MSNSSDLVKVIWPLVDADGSRKSEFAKRRKSFDEESFPTEMQALRESEGWTLGRQNKTTVRMRRPKKFDEILENRFWNVLYKFGYSDLNKGRNFKITITASGVGKQIDVFAKDDETVIVAECKASEKNSKRSMQKDLGEFGGNQKAIATAVRSHYGQGFKPKILWFFVTDKIRWSDSDLKRAEELNIHVIQSRELLYFEEIAKNLGKAAKYQFQAEYLASQKVPAFSNRKVPAIKIKIGGKKAYLFSARPIDVLRISFVNHRDLRDPAGAPTYQRLVNPARLKKISKFLDDGGFFPNTILLNFRRSPSFEQMSKDDLSGIQFGNLILPDRYKSCWVVDGQHRLYGTTFQSNKTQDNLFFLAFDKLKSEEEANTFITINDTQARVSKKLLAELDGDVKWDSPDKREQLKAIASRTVDLLGTSGSSPFEDRITTPGVTSGEARSITLPDFRDAILGNKLLGQVTSKGDFVPGPCWETNAENSLLRTFNLLNIYFVEMEQANVARWEGGRSTYLCTNFGVSGHVRLISELITYAAIKDGLNVMESEPQEIYDVIQGYLVPVIDFVRGATDSEFEERFKVPFGSGGRPRYFFGLVGLVRENEKDFKPEGYEEYIQTVSDEETAAADKKVKWIQESVASYLIKILKTEYGDKFFEKGVPADIQIDCQRKRIGDGPEKQFSIETYLDWIHLKKIADVKLHRPLVSNVLSIKLETENKGKHFYADWFDRFNDIRKIAAHPAGRFYRQEDIVFLNMIEKRLMENLTEVSA